MKLLEIIPGKIDCILIDGFVSLGRDQRPGMGWYLWEALSREVPIIGVAKTKFLETPEESQLLRGLSTRPLYISVAGIGLNEARENILNMHGAHRMPTLLKMVDNLARGLINF